MISVSRQGADWVSPRGGIVRNPIALPEKPTAPPAKPIPPLQKPTAPPQKPTVPLQNPTVPLRQVLDFLKGKPIDDVLVLVQSIDNNIQVGAEQVLETKGLFFGSSYTGHEDNPVKVTSGEWTVRSRLALQHIDTYSNDITLYTHCNKPDTFSGKFRLGAGVEEIEVHLQRSQKQPVPENDESHKLDNSRSV